MQGMRRYYALLLAPGGQVHLVKGLDGERILAERAFQWQLDVPYHLDLQVTGNRIQARIDGGLVFDVADRDQALTGGGVALICTEGRLDCDKVQVSPRGN